MNRKTNTNKAEEETSIKVIEGFNTVKAVINHCLLYQSTSRDMSNLLQKIIDYCQIIKTNARQ